MSQEYTVGGEIYRISVGSEAEGAREITVVQVTGEGKEVASRKFLARLLPVEQDTYQLLLDGRSYLVCSASLPEEEEVFIEGESYHITTPEKTPARRRSGAREAEQHVTPPMPGVVIKIMAKVGDKVEKGQGIIVISAMKMETTLSSPRSGIVTKVNTEVDAQVKPGDVLIEVEEESSAA